MLPEPLRPSRVTRSDDVEELAFEKWALIRFARLAGPRTEIPIVLRGVAADGSPFSVWLPLVYDFEQEPEP